MTVVFLSLPVFAQSGKQDCLYLKNGSIIRGEIIEQIPNKTIKIQTKDGNLFVYNYEDVEKITREYNKSRSSNYDSNSNEQYEASDADNEAADRTNYFNQTVKGVVSLSGQLMYSNYSYEDFSYSYFDLSSGTGYFFMDNLLAGIQLSYYSYGGDISDDHRFSFGPKVEYYFGNMKNKPFVSFDVLFSSTEDYNDTQITFGVGYNLALAKNISLQPIMEYRLTSPEGGSLGDIKTFLIGMKISNFLF